MRDVDAGPGDDGGADPDRGLGRFPPQHPAKGRSPDQRGIIERGDDGGRCVSVGDHLEVGGAPARDADQREDAEVADGRRLPSENRERQTNPALPR